MENTINMPGGGSLVGAAATTERCEGLVRVDCSECGETSYQSNASEWGGKCPYCASADPDRRAALKKAQAERRIERCARAVAELVSDTNRHGQGTRANPGRLCRPGVTGLPHPAPAGGQGQPPPVTRLP